MQVEVLYLTFESAAALQKSLIMYHHAPFGNTWYIPHAVISRLRSLERGTLHSRAIVVSVRQRNAATKWKHQGEGRPVLSVALGATCRRASVGRWACCRPVMARFAQNTESPLFDGDHVVSENRVSMTGHPLTIQTP